MNESQLLLPLVSKGTEHGEKAFHVVDPKLREDHVWRMKSAGIDMSQAEKSGQLLQEQRERREREELPTTAN